MSSNVRHFLVVALCWFGPSLGIPFGGYFLLRWLGF